MYAATSEGLKKKKEAGGTRLSLSPSLSLWPALTRFGEVPKYSIIFFKILEILAPPGGALLARVTLVPCSRCHNPRPCAKRVFGALTMIHV
jgi:hypothetical protein